MTLSMKNNTYDKATYEKNPILLWWNSIDNKSFIALLFLILIGLILIATASPVIAAKIGVPHFSFIRKQFYYTLIALPTILFFSIIKENQVKKICFIGLVITIVSLMLLPFVGDETKGAKRWLIILGFSLQPSEFIKPFYTVIVAAIFAEGKIKDDFPSFAICTILHLLIMGLLLMQPDLGMAVTICVVTGVQFFIAGLSLKLVLLLFVLFTSMVYLAYLFFPHVAKRIDHFLGNDLEIGYQVQKSLESYAHGGFLGTGPGEGSVKYALPDLHSDFIFSVAAEEFGIIFCIAILSLIAFIVIKGFINVSKMRNLYRMYAAIGIVMYIAFQSIFNIGVTLNILPTKGMTLPFVSYGGSSLIAMAIAVGIYFNLTKYTKTSGLGNNVLHIKIR
ncbi:Cell wall polymerase [Alphaproteobacteria bacterium]